MKHCLMDYENLKFTFISFVNISSKLLLRNPVVQHELLELHTTWIYTLKWIVHPCMMKINAFFEEGIAVPDSNLNKKLDYLKLINKELNVLNDGFYQYCSEWYQI